MRRAHVLLALIAIVWSLGACGSGEEEASSSPPFGAAIEVVFDGASCSAAGATTIPAGDHAFLLTDTSERERTEMWVAYLDDGYTYEDLLELQQEAGGQGSTTGSRPAFVVAVPMFAPPTTPTEGQTLYSHTVSPGQHAFVVGGSDGQWICGSFDVTDG